MTKPVLFIECESTDSERENICDRPATAVVVLGMGDGPVIEFYCDKHNREAQEYYGDEVLATRGLE